MKKKFATLFIAGLSALMLCSGCGALGGAKSSRSSYNSDGAEGAGVTGYNDGYFGDDFSSSGRTYDGGYYASFESNDTKMDYSYSFTADGNTKMSRQTAVDFLEEIETFALDNKGYISDVKNTWTSYDTVKKDLSEDYYGSERRYHTFGTLSFTLYIPNENLEQVNEKLQAFCDANDLLVTGYTQTATSYQAFKVSEDADSYIYDDNLITQEDLDNRLATTTYGVTINYHRDRNGFEKAGMTIHNILYSIGQTLTDLLESIAPLFLAFAIPGGVIIFVYNACTVGAIKSRYKLYSKHPEYFEIPYGREIRITNIDKVCDALKETKAPATATDATPVVENVAKAPATNETPVAEDVAKAETTEDNND